VVDGTEMHSASVQVWILCSVMFGSSGCHMHVCSCNHLKY
jgi:hypothetical protein